MKKPLHEVVLARLVTSAELVEGAGGNVPEIVAGEHLSVLMDGKMKAEDARNVASQLRELRDKLIAVDQTSLANFILQVVEDLESRVDEPEGNSVLALYTHDE